MIGANTISNMMETIDLLSWQWFMPTHWEGPAMLGYNPPCWFPLDHVDHMDHSGTCLSNKCRQSIASWQPLTIIYPAWWWILTCSEKTVVPDNTWPAEVLMYSYSWWYFGNSANKENIKAQPHTMGEYGSLTYWPNGGTYLSYCW